MRAPISLAAAGRETFAPISGPRTTARSDCASSIDHSTDVFGRRWKQDWLSGLELQSFEKTDNVSVSRLRFRPLPQRHPTLTRRHLSRSLICRSMPSDTTPGTIRGPKCCANAASSPIGQQRANQVNASSPNLPLTLPTQHRASAAAPVPATARRASRCAARRRTVATDMLDLRSACGRCSHLSVVVFASLRATAHCGEPRFAPSKYRP
jgi:hypothetical protein